MRRLLTIARHLSLDVVAGALCSGAMATELLGASMPLSWWISLPVSVWVIYTTDHLLDAQVLKDQAHTPRHLFHHLYRIPLWTLWGLGIAFSAIWVPFWIPRPIFWFGVAMGGLVLIHLLLVRWSAGRSGLFWQKEFGVALIYSLGVWGGPVVLQQPLVWMHFLIPFLQFLVLAYMNLLIFSWYELETDELDQQTSLARGIGSHATLRLITGLALVVISTGLLELFRSPMPKTLILELVLAAMLAVLWWVIKKPEIFRLAKDTAS